MTQHCVAPPWHRRRWFHLIGHSRPADLPRMCRRAGSVPDLSGHVTTGDQRAVLQLDRDRVEDVEGKDPLRFEIAETTSAQRPSRCWTNGAANRAGSAMNGRAFEMSHG